MSLYYLSWPPDYPMIDLGLLSLYSLTSGRGNTWSIHNSQQLQSIVQWGVKWQLNGIWTYTCTWNEYTNHNCFFPAVSSTPLLPLQNKYHLIVIIIIIMYATNRGLRAWTCNQALRVTSRARRRWTSIKRLKSPHGLPQSSLNHQAVVGVGVGVGGPIFHLVKIPEPDISSQDTRPKEIWEHSHLVKT